MKESDINVQVYLLGRLVDGVLTSTNFDCYCTNNGFNNWWSYGLLDQDCIMRLKRLVKQTDAHIVLCSSWRASYDHMARLEQQLALYGLSIYGTTNEDSSMGRGQQIMEWVHNHENCTDFVVFDDDNDIRDYPPETEVTAHLVVPLYNEGLRDVDIEEAYKILTGQE